ncbi:MAG: hypothetical protein GX153_01710 [Clostridiaceae bacterium]|nr:hypothetical protein [Clostridiaceae bacterium]
MKKNFKMGVALLALLLVAGLAVTLAPRMVSAQEDEAAPPATVETDDQICPVTGEARVGAGAGQGAGEGAHRGWSDEAGQTPNRFMDGECAGNCDLDGDGEPDGDMIRQRLQDGSGTGGQQRGRARDGSCGNTVVPQS